MKVSNHATRCIECNKELCGQQQKYCSHKCHSKIKQNNSYEAQMRRAKKRKELLVNRLGGKCIKCGYKKNLSALHFHHKEEFKKSISLDSRNLSNHRMDLIEKEVLKCELLCSNCHAEHHHPNHSIL